jgi:hypothetical protein
MLMTKEAFADEAVLAGVSGSVSASLRIRSAIKRYWHWAAAVALAILLWAPRLSGPIDLRWDAGVYYVLGTSLATGHGYRILSEPGSPEAIQYPPLLPAVVALYERALGSTDPAVVAPWLRISYAAVFLVYAWAALALARRYLSAEFAVAAVTLSLLQFHTLFLSDLLFTELPFALVSVVFARVAVNGSQASRPWLREAVSFALALAGFLLRTAGVALLAAWALEALARRHWRLALTRGLLALLPILAWQTHVARVRGSYEYAHPAYEYQRAAYQFYNVSYADNASLINPYRPELGRVTAGALIGRVARDLLALPKAVGEAISTSEEHWRQLLLNCQQWTLGRKVIALRVVLVPIITFSMLVIVGIGVLVQRRAWLMVFVLLASLGLICTTPWPDQFQRYLMPLSPFLAIAAMLALSQSYTVLRAKIARPTTWIVTQAMIVALISLPLMLASYTTGKLFYLREHEGASFVPGSGAVGQHFFNHDQKWIGWEQAIAWIKEHSTPNDIVATSASHLCYLRTGRRAVAPPVESDPTHARYLLESVPVSYVIVDRGYSLPPVESDAPGWHLVQSFGGIKLYERTARLNQ